MRNALGHDCWELDIPLEVFLERARVNALELQHIRVVNQRVRFMTPLFQRAKVRHAFKEAVLITTSGASGFRCAISADPRACSAWLARWQCGACCLHSSSMLISAVIHRRPRTVCGRR